MEKAAYDVSYNFAVEDGMKRLCGLMIFCIGVGMTWVLIIPKSFLMVLIAIALLIAGYNLFCC